MKCLVGRWWRFFLNDLFLAWSVLRTSKITKVPTPKTPRSRGIMSLMQGWLHRSGEIFRVAGSVEGGRGAGRMAGRVLRWGQTGRRRARTTKTAETVHPSRVIFTAPDRRIRAGGILRGWRIGIPDTGYGHFIAQNPLLAFGAGVEECTAKNAFEGASKFRRRGRVNKRILCRKTNRDEKCWRKNQAAVDQRKQMNGINAIDRMNNLDGIDLWIELEERVMFLTFSQNFYCMTWMSVQ